MAQVGGLQDDALAVPGLGPLGHHHQGVHASPAVPLPDLGGHLVQVEGDLGDEDGVGAPGDARVQGDPAGVAAHHLHHHHPLVALGGAVQAVQALGGERHGGVEAERGEGLVQVVVDGLGHPHHPQPLLRQGVGDGQGAVAAHRDQGVQFPPGEEFQDLVGAVHLPHGAVGHAQGEAQGIAPVGGAQDGAAQVGDAPHPVPGEADHAAVLVALREEDAVEPFPDAVAFPAPVHGGQHHGADDGVQPRGVSPAGADGDASDRILHGLPLYGQRATNDSIRAGLRTPP